MFQNAILGQVVLTDYTNKTYRVDDVVFNENPATTFEGKNNEKTSFIDYYQKRYNIRIRDVSKIFNFLPFIIFGKKAVVFLQIKIKVKKCLQID